MYRCLHYTFYIIYINTYIYLHFSLTLPFKKELKAAIKMGQGQASFESMFLLIDSSCPQVPRSPEVGRAGILINLIIQMKKPGPQQREELPAAPWWAVAELDINLGSSETQAELSLSFFSVFNLGPAGTSDSPSFSDFGTLHYYSAQTLLLF